MQMFVGLPSLIYHAADPLHGHHPTVEMRAAPQDRRRPSFTAVAEMVAGAVVIPASSCSLAGRGFMYRISTYISTPQPCIDEEK
jgi:hypothetical protein